MGVSVQRVRDDMSDLVSVSVSISISSHCLMMNHSFLVETTCLLMARLGSSNAGCSPSTTVFLHGMILMYGNFRRVLIDSTASSLVFALAGTEEDDDEAEEATVVVVVVDDALDDESNERSSSPSFTVALLLLMEIFFFGDADDEIDTRGGMMDARWASRSVRISIFSDRCNRLKSESTAWSHTSSPMRLRAVRRIGRIVGAAWRSTPRGKCFNSPLSACMYTVC